MPPNSTWRLGRRIRTRRSDARCPRPGLATGRAGARGVGRRALARARTATSAASTARGHGPAGGPDWWLGTPWENVRAAGLFDDGWYQTAYPDIPEDEDPLWHFATRGAAAGRDPNPLFDTTWYLTTYDDVRRSGVNPLVHYLEFRRGPRPGAWLRHPLVRRGEPGRALVRGEPARPLPDERRGRGPPPAPVPAVEQRGRRVGRARVRRARQPGPPLPRPVPGRRRAPSPRDGRCPHGARGGVDGPGRRRPRRCRRAVAHGVGQGGRARRAPGPAGRRRRRVRRGRPHDRPVPGHGRRHRRHPFAGADRGRGRRLVRGHAPHRRGGRRLHGHDAHAGRAPPRRRPTRLRRRERFRRGHLRAVPARGPPAARPPRRRPRADRLRLRLTHPPARPGRRRPRRGRRAAHPSPRAPRAVP